MKEIVNAAEKYALDEIKKYRFPSLINYNTSNDKGLELAKKLKVDINIVQIGTRVMDVKLGQCIAEGKLLEHVKLSVKATKEFLNKFDISKEDKEKIVNCVEAHHKDVPWICKEAEICANADCYRFIRLKNWLDSVGTYLTHFNLSMDEALKRGEKKADEKWAILSLDLCKKELEPNYNLIKEIVRRAKS